MADNTENAANEPVPSADQPDKKTDDFSEELPQDPGSEAPLNPAAAPKADAPRPTPTAAPLTAAIIGFDARTKSTQLPGRSLLSEVLESPSACA